LVRAIARLKEQVRRGSLYPRKVDTALERKKQVGGKGRLLGEIHGV